MTEKFDDAMIGELLAKGQQENSDENENKVRASFWKTLKKAAGQMPMAEDVVASYYCALDPQTANKTRGLLLAALAYFVLPTDFIPDFLAGFGFTDDLALLTTAIGAIRSELKEKHFVAARTALERTLKDN